MTSQYFSFPVVVDLVGKVPVESRGGLDQGREVLLQRVEQP